MNETVSHPPEGKQERILAVASQLFNRFGPKKTTIDDIAREAGLGKGTIYLYFKSKDEIFLTVVRLELQSLCRRLQDAVAAEGTIEERLQRYLLVRFAHLQEIFERVGHSAERIKEGGSQPGMDALRLQQVQTEARIVRGVLEDGVRDGSIVCADPAVASLAIVTMGLSICMAWVLEGQPLDSEYKVRVMLDLILNGLRRRS